MLYWLTSLETTSALPWSVCPYTPHPGSDHVCPGLKEALAVNPLRFTTRSINWWYEQEDTKARHCPET